MMTVSPRRAVFAFAIFSALPLLVACPKKTEPAPFDAGPPPAPVEDVQTNLVPMEEDAGTPDADAGKPKYTGPGVSTNVLRLKQCCNAIGAEGKRLGASPEGGMFTAAAAQCNTLAAQAGATGTAPELAVVRGMLAGRTLPAACSGL
jgi:hypothetical protein